MRTKQILLTGLLPFLTIPVAAQLPEVSTADSPKWYYIRVVGDAARADRMFTATDAGRVVGQPQSTSTDIEEIARQLWRFEKNKQGRYTITNWKTGLSLDVTYDATENTGLACLEASPAVTFAITPIDTHYQIQSSAAAPGTPAGEVYIHQGNSGYDYAVITVGTNYGSSSSSQFDFVPFHDFRYQLSDTDTHTYYTIANAGAEYAGKVISRSTDSDCLILTNADATNKAAQWRAEADATGQGVRWINRATGEELKAAAMPAGLLNLLVPATIDLSGEGWTMTHIGLGQYTFTSTEGDDIKRYMGADPDNTTEAATPDPLQVKNSPFAWTLNKIETISTGIDTAPAQQATITVRDGRICVDGVADWSIYGLNGILYPHSTRLMPGIYMVKTGEQVTKIIIK